MKEYNWEWLGYNSEGGTGYKCKKCGAIFSDYVTTCTDGKCPGCGCPQIDKEKNK